MVNSLALLQNELALLEEELSDIEEELAEPQLESFYGTFGFASENRKNYVALRAPDLTSARAIMWEVYGSKWADVYPEHMKQIAIDSFHLNLLETWTWYEDENDPRILLYGRMEKTEGGDPQKR